MRAPIAPKTATSCSNAPAGPTTRLGIADAGERDPVELAALRHGRCKKSHEEFAEYLTGNWREEHRFNLESALKLYDAIQQRIASYEARLLNELHALEPEPRPDQPVPEHPNPVKEEAIRNRGEHKARATLWRFAGVDLTRIDGISIGADRIILTEVGLDLSSFPSEHHFVSWLRLSPRTPISGGKLLQKKKPNGAPQRRRCRRLRHCQKAGYSRLSDASLRTRLPRHRRYGIRGPIPTPTSRQPRCRRSIPRLHARPKGGR